VHFQWLQQNNAVIHLMFLVYLPTMGCHSCRLAYCNNVHQSADRPHARLNGGGKGQTTVVREDNDRLFRLNSESELTSVYKGNIMAAFRVFFTLFSFNSMEKNRSGEADSRSAG
jgi:hypothetical protein